MVIRYLFPRGGAATVFNLPAPFAQPRFTAGAFLLPSRDSTTYARHAQIQLRPLPRARLVTGERWQGNRILRQHPELVEDPFRLDTTQGRLEV